MNFPQKLLLPRKAPGPLSASRPQHFSSRAPVSLVARLIGLIPGVSGRPLTELPPSQLNPLFHILNGAERIDPRLLAPKHVLRRIGWRMRINSIRDIGVYRKLLLQNPAELPALRKSLKMRISDFYREPNLFFAIENSVLPVLLKEPSVSGIHALVERDKTGSIAYSLAMLLHLHKQAHRQSSPIHIAAYHANRESETHVDQILYPHLVTMDLSPQCLELFFDTTPEGYRISTPLKKSVLFDARSLDSLSSPNSYDILIASNHQAVDESSRVDMYNTLLKPGGFLFFTPSKHSEKLPAYFDVLDSKTGLYRKRIKKKQQKIASVPSPPAHEAQNKAIKSMVERLENELHATRERLDVTIGEYESTHDALVTQNKKILAVNNRLETVLSLCGVGVLYLDQELCIDMYTGNVAALFGLHKTDIGRPFSHLKSPFQVHLFESAKSAIRSRASMEQERKSKQGVWYRITLSPHIIDDRVAGLVCSFLNITESKREHEWDRFRAKILNRVNDAIIVTNRSGRVTYVNKAAINRFGLYHKKKTGFLLDELYQPAWKSTEAELIAQESLVETGDWSGELYHITPEGKRNRVRVTMHLLEDEAGKEIGRLTVIRDDYEINLAENDALRRIIEDLAERNASFETEEYT